MRYQFDPVAQLVYQNQQQQQQHGNPMMQRPMPTALATATLSNNPFGSGFSVSNAHANPNSTASGASPFSLVGAKRAVHTIDERGCHHDYEAAAAAAVLRDNCDDDNCDDVLRSSMKRVRLSRCPGEFRLQRDLKMLDSMQWGSSQVARDAAHFSSTTWIHRSTGARLTMVDSLRMCLFLPVLAANNDNNNNAATSGSGSANNSADPQKRFFYQHQHQSYHFDYRWRIMIQIPRMYPHSPPIVSRVEGLALESISINELPPNAARQQQQQQHQHQQQQQQQYYSAASSNNSNGSHPSGDHSTSAVTTPLFFTEVQLARSTASSSSTVSTEGNGRTIEWNQWSPIAGLGELLDFLLAAAASNLSATTNANAMAGTMIGNNNNNNVFGLTSVMQQPIANARMSSSSSASLSSVSSTSSVSSSWGNSNRNRSNNYNNNNNTMMSDENENATTASNATTVSGASFLSPNRFDVGYGKYQHHRDRQQLQQQQLQQGAEDICMDMS